MSEEALGQRAVAAARAFRFAGAPRSIERFGSGHIHDTFAVRCDGPDGAARYVLQRINAHVFREPERVIENAVRVSEHLRRQLAARGTPDLERRALHWCESRDSGFAYRDGAQGIWRACALIEGTHTRDVVESPAEADAAGRAFGDFLARMADLDPGALHEVIPGFHDLRRYARRLEEASAADPAGRARECGDELAAVRHALVQHGPAWAALQALPRRVVHADCKVNNVLLDTKSDMRVNCEEIFGPVTTLRPYADFDQAIATVNDSPYGIQAGLFTNDMRRILHAFAGLELGGLVVNDIPGYRVDHLPYGGVKQSGLGREGVRYAIEEMTDLRVLMLGDT